MKPGTRIDQAQLAEDLNVSIVPVREALKSLDVEGFVTIVPRRGAFVTDISVNDMDELYEARQIIEGEAIFRAVPVMSDQDFAHLRELVNLMQKTTAERDVPEYVALNREFHLHIYNCLRNQYLVQVIQNLWERSELYRYRYLFVTRNTDAIHQEHLAIIEACEARDQALARQKAMDHIQHTRMGLRQHLSSEPE